MSQKPGPVAQAGTGLAHVGQKSGSHGSHVEDAQSSAVVQGSPSFLWCRSLRHIPSIAAKTPSEQGTNTPSQDGESAGQSLSVTQGVSTFCFPHAVRATKAIAANAAANWHDECLLRSRVTGEHSTAIRQLKTSVPWRYRTTVRERTGAVGDYLAHVQPIAIADQLISSKRHASVDDLICGDILVSVGENPDFDRRWLSMKTAVFKRLIVAADPHPG